VTLDYCALYEYSYLLTYYRFCLCRYFDALTKGIRPVKKTELWGAGMVMCLERGADLHMAQLMPLPLTVSCFSKIQIGVTFLVPAHPGSPGKRSAKWVCVCVFVSSQDNAVWDVRMDEQIMSWAVQRPEDWQLGGRCEALMWGGGRIGQLGEAGRTALTPTTAQSFACAQQVK